MSAANSESVAPLVEHFFRNEAGRLVAVLTRGLRSAEPRSRRGYGADDSGRRPDGLAQSHPGQPIRLGAPCCQEQNSGCAEAPSNWQAGDRRARCRESATGRGTRSALSRQRNRGQPARNDVRLLSPSAHSGKPTRPDLESPVRLRQLGNRPALLVPDETVKKRLQRATQSLLQHQTRLEVPPPDELLSRLDSVHQVLYLLFNEGYSTSEGDLAIRTDLCEEAARLCHLLCSHPRFATPSTHALMALMLFHAARLDARLDQGGSLLLMDEQDRSQWDQRLIGRAQEFLDAAAQGTVVSTFHLEAGIALLHCSAESYDRTDWRGILRLYDALLAVHRSPVYELNRAIVVAQIDGPRAGIQTLNVGRPRRGTATLSSV